ncbi:hypothetical protein Scep_019409 [Stephania cephalantha]|uniref:Uncharacterized protein n=1 Tax=Stephania cephalantha TaxID=152367 RepID=A0AAP0IAV3_9MAGN
MQNRKGERNLQVAKSPGRETKKKSKTGREVERFVVCDLVNVRGKVVISSFTYNGLANPTKNGGIV